MQKQDADLSVRQQAAIQFKNTIKHRWSIQSPEPQQGQTELRPEIREQIKQHILNVMVSVPKILQSQVLRKYFSGGVYALRIIFAVTPTVIVDIHY